MTSLTVNSEPWLDLLRNPCVWAAGASWLVAQLTKMLCGFVASRRLDFSYLASVGGMPSAHSAFACGLATATAMTEGMGSAVFAVAAGFALITMFDASTVRRAAGQQARLLNQIVDELFHEHHLSEKKLVELLGHTRVEVFMGMLYGILTATLVVAQMAR